MKFYPAIFLLIFTFALSVFGQSGGSVSGKLLKSNGSPLPYTEIELVPVSQDKQTDDTRLWATSNSTGSFSFSDVPGGKYTLSINFDEKPTDNSPYQTFFYPANSNRTQAKTFVITAGEKITGINFRVPPPLAQRRVVGKVVGADGKPVSGAFVYLRDVEYDKSLDLELRSDRNGNFTLSGFETRQYQIGALLFEQANPSILDSPGKMIASAYSPIFTLAATSPNFTLVLEDSDEVKKLREKNVGRFFSKLNFSELLKANR